MHIDGFRKNSVVKKEEKIDNLFLHHDDAKAADSLQEDDYYRNQDEEMEKRIIGAYAKNALCHWQAYEFEVYEEDKRWTLYMAIALVIIIAYAVYANSPMMAITFILIGFVGYVYMDKEPRILDFMVTDDGIVAGKEIFQYDRIKSFWIFYEEDGSKVISLHMRSIITPYLHIPIGEEDPVKIRECLLHYIEEIKQEHNIVETLERFFRI